MRGKSRQRILSAEELRLWALVTRHDEPFSSDAKRQLTSPEDAPPEAGGEKGPAGNDGSKSKAPAPLPNPVPQRRKMNVSKVRPEPFDPKAAKQIARGRREIAARLDLHGMRQEDAYTALLHFLNRCQTRGYRDVLIITGKGGDTRPDRNFWKQEKRGVLRRLVPQWLSESAFRDKVVSYTESALRHGGSGALYVTIRKRGRSGE
jgi:DNA-nicking Smr family endonuclease